MRLIYKLYAALKVDDSFDIIEKEFSEEEPIDSRILAFRELDLLIEHLELTNALFSAFNYQRDDFYIYLENNELIQKEYFFEFGDKLSIKALLLNDDGDIEEEYVVHSHLNLHDFHCAEIIDTLFLEFNLYPDNNWGVKDQMIQVSVYDIDERKIVQHNFLKTRYNLNLCLKKYETDMPGLTGGVRSIYEEEDFMKIISGESSKVEFKPCLLYNFKTETAGIGIKYLNAKVICAFLNSEGGSLVIGMNDHGKPHGLNFDYNILRKDKEAKDAFQLEFSSLINYFFKPFVNQYIETAFIEIEEKELFLVKVKKSLNNPVFLKGREGKEFFIRVGPSNKQLDIQECAEYVITKWHLNKYKL